MLSHFPEKDRLLRCMTALSSQCQQANHADQAKSSEAAKVGPWPMTPSCYRPGKQVARLYGATEGGGNARTSCADGISGVARGAPYLRQSRHHRDATPGQSAGLSADRLCDDPA